MIFRSYSKPFSGSFGGYINASTDFATVTFSKPYQAVPAVVGSDGLVVTNVTTGGFTMQYTQAVPANTNRDFAIVVGV